MVTLRALEYYDIDKDSPLPLYLQVRDALMNMITESGLQPGSLIPTEREIGDALKVSRITVRRAIDELVRRGFLVTYQGKGTFVARPKIQRRTTQMKSYTEQMLEEGKIPGSQLLTLRHEKASRQVATALQIKPGDWVWAVERLRSTDNEIICISLSYLNLPPDISLTPFELQQQQSLWSILEEKGFKLKHTETTIQAVPASSRQAELLEIASGSPLLLIEGVVYVDDGTPIECHQIFNRGDRYKVFIQSSR
jgi:GntR family transcriptional regulator